VNLVATLQRATLQLQLCNGQLYNGVHALQRATLQRGPRSTFSAPQRIFSASREKAMSGPKSSVRHRVVCASGKCPCPVHLRGSVVRTPCGSFIAKYHVQAINYKNYTVRVVDPALQLHNCSSLPLRSLSRSNFSDTYTHRI